MTTVRVQKDLPAYIETEPRLWRPCNYPAGTPGSGSVVLEAPKGPVGVLNVRGLTLMNPPLENPLHRAGVVEICGVLVDVDETSGRASGIRRIRETIAA